MLDLVFFGILAGVLYAAFYWLPVSAWVLAGIGIYIVISDEIKWWRHERPKARSAEERRRWYVAHWATLLAMNETAYRLRGLNPLPTGTNFGSEYRRVLVVLVFWVGVIIVGATQFFGADSEERYDVGYDDGFATGGGGHSNSASPASLPPSASISVSAQDNVSEHEYLKEVMDNGHAQELARRPNPYAPRRELTGAEQQFIKARFADDLARCRAFLIIGANGNPGQAPVTRTSATDEIDALLLMTAGSVETAAAKHRLQLDTMTREMEGSFNNFSRLIVKHGEFCADLLRDPTPRLEYWMARARQQLQR